jgi:histidinol-phosphate aminotransferase
MTSSDYDIKNLVRHDFQNIACYVPIEPPDIVSSSGGIAPDDIIKLDGNENPYGCSEKVNRALAKYSQFHIYPDPQQRKLRAALEEFTGYEARNIVAGAGSDELIDVILRLFLEPGDSVINLVPTFGMYPFCTEICAGHTISVPRLADFSLDIAAIEKACDKRTKVVFIASPNNPSGNTISEKELERILKLGIIVVVDEAYAEFSGHTISHMVKNHLNLIVLRTFSKWAGLAGLRVGYGIFPEYIARYIMKIKQPYNINAAAQVAALISLDDIDYLRKTISLILQERKRLWKELQNINWLKTFPTEANFILCQVMDGNAKDIHAQLKEQGILIRYFDTPLLQNYIRISVGKPAHTDKLIDALKKAHS